MKKVIILGAGITGLTAALKLAEKNIPVEILEASSTIGGLAKNTHYKGFTYDMGPHRIYSEFPEILDFMKELCGAEWNSVPRKSRMRLLGRYFSYPFDKKELLRYLPPELWLKFLFSYLSIHLFPRKKKIEESSYEGYLTQRFGKALCDFFFLPYAQKVWGISPQNISSDIAQLRLSQKNLLMTIRDLLKKPDPNQPISFVANFNYPRKGIGVIAEALQSRLDKYGVPIHLNSRVTDFQVEKTLYGNSISRISWETDKGIQNRSAEYILSTIPLPELVSLTHPDSQEISMIAKSLRYRSVILVCLLLRKPYLTDDHWLYFPEPDFHITRMHQPKNFSIEMCPINKSSIVAELTCSPDDARWNSTDLEIYDYTLGDFLTSGLVHETDIEDYSITRVRHAYPIYDTQYQHKLTQIYDYLKLFNNLITTGRQGIFHHNNIDQAILMGQKASQFISQDPSSISQWYEIVKSFYQFRVVD